MSDYNTARKDNQQFSLHKFILINGEVYIMEQLIHRLADDIVEHGRGIERMFILIFLCCAIMSPFVVVNYDLSEYLPETAQSEQGLRLMEEEFGYPGTARLMIEDVSLYQAKSIKKQIEALSQVDQVL